MKKIILISVCLLISGWLSAQKFPDLDASPADIAMGRTKDKQPLVKVVYGRPQKKGRIIFGELEPYGKVWRTGANEAPEIKIYKDITIGGKPLKAGTYALFTIPEKDKWTLIFNSELDQWGAYTYNKDKDVLRIELKPAKTDATVEAFSIMFRESKLGVDMLMAWDEVMVEVPLVSTSTKKK